MTLANKKSPKRLAVAFMTSMISILCLLVGCGQGAYYNYEEYLKGSAYPSILLDLSSLDAQTNSIFEIESKTKISEIKTPVAVVFYDDGRRGFLKNNSLDTAPRYSDAASVIYIENHCQRVDKVCYRANINSKNGHIHMRLGSLDGNDYSTAIQDLKKKYRFSSSAEDTTAKLDMIDQFASKLDWKDFPDKFHDNAVLRNLDVNNAGFDKTAITGPFMLIWPKNIDYLSENKPTRITDATPPIQFDQWYSAAKGTAILIGATVQIIGPAQSKTYIGRSHDNTLIVHGYNCRVTFFELPVGKPLGYITIASELPDKFIESQPRDDPWGKGYFNISTIGPKIRQFLTDRIDQPT